MNILASLFGHVAKQAAPTAAQATMQALKHAAKIAQPYAIIALKTGAVAASTYIGLYVSLKGAVAVCDAGGKAASKVIPTVNAVTTKVTSVAAVAVGLGSGLVHKATAIFSTKKGEIPVVAEEAVIQATAPEFLEPELV